MIYNELDYEMTCNF